ncbi:glycosyltransferase family 1 protein [Flagellimonas sp. S174]|uniref:glycosyltransferase family 1 protein n=1 Tax=Flagellimonas sp. S174 TaxID=3410790 RepID=UPI002634CC31|nr:glycosyltransferase family 1 protein [uncultured Allomuricauda sp.]
MADKPIRVLQVINSMNRGGAETMVMNYYRNMDRSKVQFDFLVHTNSANAFDTEIRAMGGKVHRVPPISIMYISRHIKALKHFFKCHPEYNIIHAHMNVRSFLSLKYAKKTCKYRIAHSHTSLDAHSILKGSSSTGMKLKNLFLHSIRRLRLPGRYATHYFACGEKAGRWLFGNKKKIKVVNNAINPSTFVYDPDKSAERKKEFNVHDSLVFGHVGRFSHVKNHRFLIKVFKEIVELEPNSKLLLVGNGPLVEENKAFVHELGLENDVIFLGHRSDIPETLQAIDLFILPSLYEGLPVSVVEAQAAGINVIISDTVTKEVGITPLAHFLSLKSSEKEWAELALSLVSNKKENMNNAIAQGGYDIKECAEDLQSLYLNFSIDSME